MLKVVLGLLTVVTVATASQIRVRYHVLDPFAPNGLWTEVSSNANAGPKNEASQTQALKQIPEEETEEGTMSMVERAAKMKQKSNTPVRNKPEQNRKQGANNPDVLHHYTKDSVVPYLPDLAALKQITTGSMDNSPLLRTAVEALKQAREQQVTVQQTRSNPRAQHLSKRHHHRKSPQPESPQLNAAPPMPQLPSLAAATDAPLPPEYPWWASRFSQDKSISHPPIMDTAFLEMDPNIVSHRSAGPSVPEEIERNPQGAFASSMLPERRPFGVRASWPSDVSPPADYFLPPEVLI